MDDELVSTTLNTRPRPPHEEGAEKTEQLRIVPNVLPGTHLPGTKLPAVGESVENCLLLAELGAGGSGVAFLAQQLTLADRPIVLKVSKDASRGEHLKLARLQHTHIMPLYWANALPSRGLYVMAMPYLARTTFSRLLYRLDESPRDTWTGQRIFELLDDDQSALPLRIATQELPAQVLKQSSWVDFVVRLGLALAEALAYTHQRGILHLDLKPANILITPDGQPILLDLDVARPPIPAGTAFVPWLGGTPEYMSPEQRAASDALMTLQPVPIAVDGRSDLYSLGLVLYHALGGERDTARPPNPLGLPRLNQDVSLGLAEILARCLAENPTERYPDSNALAEDLRRHLDDLPLRGVRNRLSERWRKWRRRRPLGLVLIMLLAGFCTTAGTAGFNLQQRNEDRRRQAETALFDGQEVLRKGQYEDAISQFLAGKEHAERTYGAGTLRTELSRRLRQAERLKLADELHLVVMRLRFHAIQEHTPRRLQWILDAAGRKVWANRDLLTDRSDGILEQVVEKNIQDRLQELVILWSELHLQITPAAQMELARSEVQQVATESERMFGPSLGLSLVSKPNGEAPGSRTQPAAVWELCALSRIALAKGDYAEATRFTQAALDQEPLGFDTNFHVGVCALRQKKYDSAVRAFSFCAGQDPRPECFMLRGQALTALGELDLALKDYNLALAKNPEMGIAYQHRGNLYRDVGKVEDAEKDFQRARKLNE